MSFRVSDLVAQGIIQGDSAYANIFYDSANTAYYLDPAGTSLLNGLTVGGSSVVTNNGGTWNINISGTSTNIASGQIYDLNSAWTAPGSSISNGFRVYRYDSAATNNPQVYDNANWLINIYSHPTGGTASYGHQLAASDTENIFFRYVNNGGFGSWRTFIHSGNYTSYSPNLTGGGASGTWGINVTGTAGSETLATVTGRGASTSTAVTFNGGATATQYALTGGFTISNASSYGQTSTWLGMSGHGIYTTSVTYIDLDGSSSTVSVRGYNNDDFAVFANTGTANSSRQIYFLPNGGNFGIGLSSPSSGDKVEIAGTLRVHTGNNWDAIQIYTDGANGYIQGLGDETGLRIRSQYGNILLADNRANVLVGTNTDYGHRVSISGTGYATSDFRAPIFYDSDNTAYYGNFAGTSNFNIVLAKGYTDPNYTRIYAPGGGFSVNNSPQSGSIKIKLPTAASYTNTMLSFTVQIYNYSTYTSRTIRVGGYTYYTTDWYNMFAYQIGDQGADDLNVRFGKDGTGACIWIGETSTSWSYPNIFITDVQSGHSQPTSMVDGWSVSIVTSFNTVQSTLTAYKNINTGNYNSYSPTLTGGGASGTWGINITGNAGYASSAGNADTVDGYHASTSNIGNYIVVRDGNGYINGNYINMTDDGNPGGGTSISSFITKQGDNYYRSVSPTNAMASIRGVASGTWGISITGSAATVGGIDNTRIIYGDNSTGTSSVAESSINGALKSGFYTIIRDGSGYMPNQNTGVNFYLRAAYYGVGNVAGMEFFTNDSTTSDLFYRNATGGGKGPWRTILHNGNYNSYSPTLTGGGASGTWGISITGDADTTDGYHFNQDLRTSAAPSFQYIGVNPSGASNNGYGISLYGGASAGPTYGIFFQGTGTYGTHGSVTGDWATYFTMNNDNSRGWIWRKASTGNVASLSAGGILQVDGDMRAPIFYDSQNTSFYGDFAGTSILNKLRLGNGAEVIDLLGMGASYYYGLGITSAYTTLYSHHQGNGVQLGYYNGTTFTPRLQVSNGGDITLTSGSSGTTGKLIFKTTDNADLNKYIMQDAYWTLVGTHSNEGFRVRDSSSTVLMTVNGTTNAYPSRVGIGNTTPSYRLHVSGDIYADGGWVRVSGTSGLYFESYGGGWHMTDTSYVRSYNSKSIHMNGGSVDYVGSLYLESGANNVHLQPNTGSYGSLQVTNSKSGWSGIRFTVSNVNLMVNSNESGFHNNSYGWQMRWENGTIYCHKNSYGGGTSATVWDSSNASRAGNTHLMYYQGFTLDANTMDPNATGFTYSVNAPTTGPVARFSTGGGYDLWLNAAYSGSGTLIYFRTRNGDAGTNNSWRRILNDGYDPYAANMNQYVRTTDSVTFATVSANDVYTTGGWFRNHTNNNGIYWSGTGWHIYPADSANMRFRADSSSTAALRLETTGGNVRGYFYANSSNEVGILNSGGGWAFRMNNSLNGFIHGNQLTINADNAAWSSIYMNDGDEGMREIHCNSNRIGFLTQAGSWGSWCGDGGDWFSDHSMRAPIFYDSQDTNYYGDFAGTSKLNTVDTFQVRNIYGVSTDHQFGIFFGNGDGTAYAIYRESGPWTHPYPDLRISFHTGIKLGANANYNGIRFYDDYTMVNQVMSVNNASDGLGANNVYVNNSLVAGSSLRAPIFYDSNDTTYYADFNNTGRSMYTAGYLQSDRMIMKGSSGGGQIYPTISYGGVSLYGGDQLTNGAYFTVTGIDYGSSPGAGSAEFVIRSTATSKFALFSYNGSTWTGRYGLFGSTGNVTIGDANTDIGYRLYVIGDIYATGNVIAYSDARVKTNIREIENPLARVLNTRGVMYDRTDNEEKDNVGFIAQELEKEFPELISTSTDGRKGVKYQNMVAVLIEAMKEQNKEIQKLKMLINGASR